MFIIPLYIGIFCSYDKQRPEDHKGNSTSKTQNRDLELVYSEFSEET